MARHKERMTRHVWFAQSTAVIIIHCILHFSFSLKTSHHNFSKGKQQIELSPFESNLQSTMVNYTCAARDLCGMSNPQSTAENPQHHCANCRKSMCGSLCWQLLSEQSVECAIPIENLSENGQSLYNSHTALICKLCAKTCSVPNSKMPATVTVHTSSAVSIIDSIMLYSKDITHIHYSYFCSSVH